MSTRGILITRSLVVSIDLFVLELAGLQSPLTHSSMPVLESGVLITLHQPTKRAIL